MARAGAGDALRSKIAAGGPYIHLEGGPYHGANYTAAAWKITTDAERWGIEQAGEQRKPVLGLYEPTKKAWAASSDDRHVPGLTATVWRWTGPVEPMNRAGRRSRY